MSFNHRMQSNLRTDTNNNKNGCPATSEGLTQWTEDELLEKIGELITCEICAQTRVLLMLKCHHLMCKSCIKKTGKGSLEQMTCPFCRQITNVRRDRLVITSPAAEIKQLLLTFTNSTHSKSTQTSDIETSTASIQTERPIIGVDTCTMTSELLHNSKPDIASTNAWMSQLQTRVADNDNERLIYQTLQPKEVVAFPLKCSKSKRTLRNYWNTTYHKVMDLTQPVAEPNFYWLMKHHNTVKELSSNASHADLCEKLASFSESKQRAAFYHLCVKSPTDGGHKLPPISYRRIEEFQQAALWPHTASPTPYKRMYKRPSRKSKKLIKVWFLYVPLLIIVNFMFPPYTYM